MYERCNTAQISKVRHYLRGTGYLLNSKNEHHHVSIDSKNKMSDDLLCFSTIAISNTKEYIEAKIRNKSVKITSVYVTEEEHNEANSIENGTIADIRLMIFKIIDTLNKETALLQEEIYDKTVKHKTKRKVCGVFL